MKATSLTGNVRLRDVSEADLPVFFQHQCEPEANQMAAFPARGWDAFMAHWTKILANPNVTAKTILLGEQVAGNIVSWQPESRRLVGYWIGRNFWGQGVATKALAEFLEVVKERPLVAYVAKHNLGSIRVLEKCGFTICTEASNAAVTPGDGAQDLVFWLTDRACSG
jgi:RimJ/RimL family protein N-acetyltransferase